MTEQKFDQLADRCEHTAAQWTSRYFLELDEGRKADPELLKGAEIMMRLSAGFRDIRRERPDVDAPVE